MFYVKSITDGDSFKVSPNWTWNSQTGDAVRANGYNTPEIGEPGYEEAKRKLEKLILHKNVELKNPIKLTYGRLLCDVYLNGTNVADYFKQYQ